MSYEPTNWKTGDVVTSTKLNHMEQGIYDNSFDVYVGTLIPDTDGGFQFPVTYNQIVSSLQAHKTIKLYVSGFIGDLPFYNLETVTGASTQTDDSSDTPITYYIVYTTTGQFYSTDPDDPISTIIPY